MYWQSYSRTKMLSTHSIQLLLGVDIQNYSGTTTIERRSISTLKLKDSKLTLSEADQSAVAGAANPIAALSTLKVLLATGSGAAVTSEIKALAAEALGMVEAAIYLDGGAARLTAVDAAVFGNFSRIRDAHKKTCVCTE